MMRGKSFEGNYSSEVGWTIVQLVQPGGDQRWLVGWVGPGQLGNLVWLVGYCYGFAIGWPVG
jgi:hypothetical protein